MAIARKSMTAVDPVCGSEVSFYSDLNGQFSGREFHFCSQSCKEQFDENPSAYVVPNPAEVIREPVRNPEGEAGGPISSGGVVTKKIVFDDKTVNFVPQAAIRNSLIVRRQVSTKSRVEPHDSLPDPYGEEAMNLDNKMEVEIPDDSVMPG